MCGLYEVWKVYGDPTGSYGVVNIGVEKCMGTLGGHRGHLYEVWEAVSYTHLTLPTSDLV